MEPSPKETYPIIYNGVLEALKVIDNKPLTNTGICSRSLCTLVKDINLALR